MEARPVALRRSPARAVPRPPRQRDGASPGAARHAGLTRRLPADDRAPSSGSRCAARSTASISCEPKNWTREALPPIHMLTGGAARAVVVRRIAQALLLRPLRDARSPRRADGPDGLPGGTAPAGASCRRSATSTSHRIRSERALHAAPCAELRRRLARHRDCRWRIRVAASSLRVLGGAAAGTSATHFAAGAASGPSASPSNPRTSVHGGGGHRPHSTSTSSPGDVDGLLFPDSAAIRARITVTGGCVNWNGEPLAPARAARSNKLARRCSAFRRRSELCLPLRLAQPQTCAAPAAGRKRTKSARSSARSATFTERRGELFPAALA